MQTDDIVFPIPLSTGYVATVRLPMYLSEADAIRISDCILALAYPLKETTNDTN